MYLIQGSFLFNPFVGVAACGVTLQYSSKLETIHSIHKYRNSNLIVDMSKKPRIKWSLQLELALLEIWQRKLNDLRRKKRNAHVYQEMAELLKSTPSYSSVNTRVDGTDIKNKICNLTQRYRSEKKGIDPLGGSRSTWIHFEKIHSIIGALPYNVGASFMKEHFNPDDGDILLRVEPGDTGDEGAIKDELVETAEAGFSDPNSATPSCSSTATSPRTSMSPVTARSKKGAKREAQDYINKELIKEIRRFNDLREKEAEENRKLREQQMEVLKVIGSTANALLEYLKKETNK